jgi:hypothetical protein
MKALCRTPYGQRFGGRVPVGDDSTALHWHLHVTVHHNGVPHDVGGLGEGPLEVGIVEGRNDLSCVGAQLGVHQILGAGPGHVDVDQRIRRFDLHVDHLDGVFGKVAVLRDNDGDGIADIPDVVLGQAGLGWVRCVGPQRADPVRMDKRVEVVGGVHRSYAGRRPGRFCVEPDDAPPSHLAAQKSCVRRAGYHDIGDVAAASRQESRVF